MRRIPAPYHAEPRQSASLASQASDVTIVPATDSRTDTAPSTLAARGRASLERRFDDHEAQRIDSSECRVAWARASAVISWSRVAGPPFARSSGARVMARLAQRPVPGRVQLHDCTPRGPAQDPRAALRNDACFLHVAEARVRHRQRAASESQTSWGDRRGRDRLLDRVLGACRVRRSSLRAPMLSSQDVECLEAIREPRTLGLAAQEAAVSAGG
jgi:hypothetical protein